MEKKETLETVRNILKKSYPIFNFYNKDRIFNEILYIFLSWRTPIVKAESLYNELKLEFHNWNALFNLDVADWYNRLQSSGKANDKARTLVKLLKIIKNDFGNVEHVEVLSEKSDSEVYQYLTSLPGIKDKSAYCIMLYAMKRAFFPADAHCLRISQRLGIIEGTNQSKQDRVKGQKTLNDLVKGDYQLCYDLHITMLQHGQNICKRKPLCRQCMLSHLCNYYGSQVKDETKRN